jgi:hypothetical protein
VKMKITQPKKMKLVLIPSLLTHQLRFIPCDKPIIAKRVNHLENSKKTESVFFYLKREVY